MQLLASWKQSFALLGLKKIKQFLAVVAKATYDLYAVLLKRLWVLWAVLVPLISYLSWIRLHALTWTDPLDKRVLYTYYYGYSQAFIVFIVLFYTLVMARPSIDRKTLSYVMHMTKKFIPSFAVWLIWSLVWIVFNIIFVSFFMLCAKYFSADLGEWTLFMDRLTFIFSLLSTLYQWTISPLLLMSIFFVLDNCSIIKAVKNGWRMFIYNYSFLVILHATLWGLMKLSGFLFVFIIRRYTFELDLFWGIGLLCLPISAAVYSIVYTKLVYEQASLYTDAPKH